MKKTVLLFITGALALALANGCSEEFLDLKPALSRSTVNAYETEDDFLIGLTAVYSSYRSMLSPYYYMAELRADNTTEQYNASNRGTGTIWYEELDEFTMTPTNDVNSYWGAGLHAVYRVNVLLKHLYEAPADIFTTKLTGSANTKSLKVRIEAEARFARAFHYFNLVRFYGDAPLVTEPIEFVDDAFAVPRAPAADVYKQILADVQFAADSLPASYSGGNKGRVTKGAALTLKAKVQMTLAQNPPNGWDETVTWGNVVTTLEAITALAPKYELAPSYAACFDPANKNGKEAIFEVQFGETSNENNGLIFSWVPRGDGVWKKVVGDAADDGAGAGHNIVTLDLLESYEPGDLRKDVSIDTAFTSSTRGEGAATYTVADTIYYINKWVVHSIKTEKGRNPCNMPIYRFADVKLMLAEAYLHAGQTGNAQTQLNDVRNRAFGGSAPAVTVSHDAIALERRRELAFEGHRWFDLLRTGKAIEVMEAYGVKEKARPSSPGREPFLSKAFNVEPYMLLYPVPYNEWLKNPSIIDQNPEWEQ
jgi:hypothetical protein